ncbi:XRE family transcriptional regulator [Vibrio cholerae]|nr:helix-turn-helix transcriptional regulator [Vibrio cholerae]
MSLIGKNIKKHRERLGLSQEKLGEAVGVTKSTISQWELGKVDPKRSNIKKLSEVFSVMPNVIEDDQEEDEYIKKIPYYKNDKQFELVPVANLPKSNHKHLFCIQATGDSMEPVLRHGSKIIMDTSQQTIVDGKMYVFCLGDTDRVKLFSHEKNGLKISSYNKEYPDEFYTSDELEALRIIGKVVFHSTKID